MFSYSTRKMTTIGAATTNDQMCEDFAFESGHGIKNGLLWRISSLIISVTLGVL